MSLGDLMKSGCWSQAKISNRHSRSTRFDAGSVLRALKAVEECLENAPHSMGGSVSRMQITTLDQEDHRSIEAPHHSIIGDREKGDSSNSSDDVVPYWSSHLQSATFERIVPDLSFE